MAMSVGIGGRPVFTGYATDRATGQTTQVQGTSLNDVLRGAANWKPAGSAVGNAKPVAGAGGSMGLNFGGNNSGNMGFQAASQAQSQQIQAARNAGQYGGTANQAGRPQTAYNTVGAANTNVMYPMGNAALGVAPMYGPGAGVPGVPGTGGIQGLLAEQKAQNDAARNTNRANVQAAQQGVRDAAGAHFSDPVTSASRDLVTQLLQNPEALNDRTMNAIRARQSNQIRSQTDNQFDRAAAALGAGGGVDAGSLAALRRSFDRQGAANTQNANTQLEIQRANQRNADIRNAIGAGQAQSGMDTGVRAGAASEILRNLPQELPDDLSGYIAAMNWGGGGGGMPSGLNADGSFAFGGAVGAGGGDPIADAGFSSWLTPKGYSGPKESTYAGFNWTDRSSVNLGDGKYGTMERALGVDPLATGGFGALGTGETIYDGRAIGAGRRPGRTSLSPERQAALEAAMYPTYY